MNMNNFQGDPAHISAEKEALGTNRRGCARPALLREAHTGWVIQELFRLVVDLGGLWKLVECGHEPALVQRRSQSLLHLRLLL